MAGLTLEELLPKTQSPLTLEDLLPQDPALGDLTETEAIDDPFDFSDVDNTRESLRRMAQENGVDEDLIIGQAEAESNFDPNVVGDRDIPGGEARGPLQTRPIALRAVEEESGFKADPSKPEDLAKGGVLYMKRRKEEIEKMGYGGEDLLDLSVAAFNAGPDRVKKDIQKAKRKFKTERPTFEQVEPFLPEVTRQTVINSRTGRKNEQVRKLKVGKEPEAVEASQDKLTITINELDQRIENGIFEVPADAKITRFDEIPGKIADTARDIKNFFGRVLERGKDRRAGTPQPSRTEFLKPETGLPSVKQFAEDLKTVGGTVEVIIEDFLIRFPLEGTGGVINGLIEYFKTGNADDFVKGWRASQGTLPLPQSEAGNEVREFLQSLIIEGGGKIDDLTEEYFAQFGGIEKNPELAATFNVSLKALFILAPIKNVGKLGGGPGKKLATVRDPLTGETVSDAATRVNKVLDLAEQATTKAEAETALRIGQKEMEKGGFSEAEGVKLQKRIDSIKPPAAEAPPQKPEPVTEKDFPKLRDEPVEPPPGPGEIKPVEPVPLPESTTLPRPEETGIPQPKPRVKPKPVPVTAPTAKRKIFRGFGRKDKIADVAGGVKGPIFTGGQFFAFDRKAAEEFGPEIEERDFDFKNPLTIQSTQEFREFLTKANAGGLTDAFPEQTPEVRAQKQKNVNAYLEAQGHDAIVIEFDDGGVGFDVDAKTGKNIKILRKTFITPQVFIPPHALKAEPTPTAAPVDEVLEAKQNSLNSARNKLEELRERKKTATGNDLILVDKEIFGLLNNIPRLEKIVEEHIKAQPTTPAHAPAPKVTTKPIEGATGQKTTGDLPRPKKITPRVPKTLKAEEPKPETKDQKGETKEGRIDIEQKQVGAGELGRLVYTPPSPKDPNLQPFLRGVLSRLNAKLARGRARPDVVLRTIIKMFRVPINEGGFAGQKPQVTGFLKIFPQTIRVRNRNNLGVVTHELGHFFSETNKEVRKIYRKHLKEMMDLSPKIYNAEALPIRLEEGFAEFFRLFLTDRNRAEVEAPDFFAEFSTFLVDNTGFNELMNEISMMIQDWQGLDPFQRWEAKTGRPPWWTELKTLNTRTVLDYMTLKTVSRKDPLVRMVEDLDPTMRASLNPAIQYQLNYGSSGLVETWLETGRFPWKIANRLDPSTWGKSLKEILAPILDQPRFSNLSTVKELSAFIGARRASELTGRNLEKLFTREEIKGVFDMVKNFDREKRLVFEQASREISEYNDDLLQFAVDGGLVSAEVAERFRLYPMYVPFFRVPDSFFKKAIKNIKGDSFKRIRGGTQNINDIIENIVKNTANIIEAAGRNATVLKALRLAESKSGGGKWLERWPMPMEGLQINTKQILDNLKKQGLDVEPEFAETVAAMQTIWRPKPFDQIDKGIMIIRDERGKQIAVKVNDPMLFEALQNVHHEHIAFVDEILRPVARTLRLSIVLSPEFWARNFSRDTEAGFIQSTTKKPFIPIFSSLSGAKELVMNTELAKLSKALGARGSSVFDAETTRGIESSRKRLSRIGGFDPKTLLFPWELIPRLFDQLERTGAGFENATRMREFRVTYEEALKAGKAPEDASFEAAIAFRELVDFGDMGTSMAVQVLARGEPFFNARIQGWTKSKRTLIGTRAKKFNRDVRRSWLKGVLGLTLPALLITAINRMNDTNQDEPEHVKNTYLSWTLGGEIYRMPKPWEYGAALQTMPQRMLDWTFDSIQDKKERNDLLAGIVGTLMQAVGGFPWTTAIRVPVEISTNYNQFLERAIESRAQLRRQPGFRYFDHTSETLKLIGERTSVSPLKMEHAVRGFFSNVGMLTLAGTDAMLEVITGDKGITKPEQTWRTLPIFRVFAPDKLRKQSRAVNEFYDNQLKAMQRASTYRLIDERDAIKAEDFIIENPGADDKFIVKDLRRASRKISGIRKEISEIRFKPDSEFPANMTKDQIAKEKRREILELKSEMTETAKEANQDLFEAELEAIK